MPGWVSEVCRQSDVIYHETLPSTCGTQLEFDCALLQASGEWSYTSYTGFASISGGCVIVVSLLSVPIVKFFIKIMYGPSSQALPPYPGHSLLPLCFLLQHRVPDRFEHNKYKHTGAFAISVR